jgi:hypothetical protein
VVIIISWPLRRQRRELGAISIPAPTPLVERASCRFSPAGLVDRVRNRPSAKAEGKPREDFIVTIDRPTNPGLHQGAMPIAAAPTTIWWR